MSRSGRQHGKKTRVTGKCVYVKRQANHAIRRTRIGLVRVLDPDDMALPHKVQEGADSWA